MSAEARPVGAVEKEACDIVHLEKDAGSAKVLADGDSGDEQIVFTEQQQRSIMKRIDRRLVLTVGALYCVSLMDRVNMSAANIAGMAKELELTGYRYAIANLVFFITYIVFQPPSTILIRGIGPRVHLSIITFLWGVVTLGMGFTKNHEQLSALRAVLGIFEAGFFPSAVYLLSTWYTRYDVGKRYSVFYIVGCLAAAFSGILCYGLMQLNGRAGLTGWRWIFLVQGLITVTLATAAYWLLVDFPDSDRPTWKFLTKPELKWVVSRIQQDRGDSAISKFEMKKFFGNALDLKIWAFAVIFFNTTTITYALAYTLPLILIGNMGFSVGQAQCLVAPPYVFAGFVMYASAVLGDRFRVRGPLIIFNMLLCLVGLPIMGWAQSSGVRYFGVFLVTAGANCNVPTIMSFQANNLRGQWKRAFCSATLVGFGGIGGIAGSLIFRDQDKKTGYKPGMYACIACAALNIILVIACDLGFKYANDRADKGGKVPESHEDDGAPDFRYTY
ncbi:phthalate transporter [Cordyceps fumosorosea ARSEF 2679]|uniref:Phthalate transporter n=1 Tax=Cordyceps fumosorosea (strain ARSEF 2679) TaxID=1081104 RepID=A0A167QMN1_CORFA|nr:phthalate transporter [Cordyceps fumosorosea ARSEF 2679]OAA57780.1 phthalate transporter [Cordyceps fumosorosea ARSEF 2679]